MSLTAATEDLEVRVPDSACTLAGFRKWAGSDGFPDRGRITYCRREIFLDLSPERANAHNEVKSEVDRVLGNLTKEGDLGKFYHDGLWLTHDGADLSHQADGTFVAWESLEAGRIQLVATTPDGDGIEMRGSPDWVLEVVSKSSERKDRETLRDAYHAAGVREYWLIDARGAEIDFTVLDWRPARFERVAAGEAGWLQSEVFGRAIRLVRVRDRRGGWSYTLLVR